MFKIERMKRLLDCDLCNEVIIDPVTMPCGYSICKTHLDNKMTDKSNNKGSYICEICKEEHAFPKKGFMINRRLQSLLEIELNTLKASPIFDECKKEIKEAMKTMREVELLETNSERYIFDYFEKIKRQIDKRGEDLKFKIDKYSEEMIKSVEINQKNYIKLSKEINQISVNIENSKKDLNELILQFDTLEFNDKKFEDIKASVGVVNRKFHKILAEYQDSLISNKKYKFEFKESPIEEIFGRVTDFQVNF